MKIDITVKVKNDNAFFVKSFDAFELFISPDSAALTDMINLTKTEFNQEVEDVSIICKMKDI